MLTLQTIVLLLSFTPAIISAAEFHPRTYKKNKTTCATVHRNGGKGEHTQTTIEMSESITAS